MRLQFNVYIDMAGFRSQRIQKQEKKSGLDANIMALKGMFATLCVSFLHKVLITRRMLS